MPVTNGEVNEALQLVYTSHEQAPCSVLGIAFPALSGRALRFTPSRALYAGIP